MGVTPEQVGTGTSVSWTIPKEISSRSDLDFIKIFRSSSVDQDYVLLDTMPSGPAGSLTTSYMDTSNGNARSMYYLVSFVATATPFESAFHITFFPPLPSELMLIEQVKRSIPPVLQSSLTDEDYLNGLNMAIQIFNVYPPETYFTLNNFPKSHLFFIIGLAQMLSLASRFLTLSIRDFRYSEPGGVVMDIDRGSKINDAIGIITKVYTQYLPLVKLDFSSDSITGLGTVQLPLSMGGIVNRGLLNILDIFTAVGR
jgi:hypothetical protein